MDFQNKEIRNYLKVCSRKEYESLIYESKLTPNESAAVELFILNEMPLIEIGEVLKCSGRTASKIINHAYAKMAKAKK